MPTETLSRLEGALSDSEIESWNEQFAELEPVERIGVAYERLGERLIAATKLAPTSPLLLDPLSQAAPDIPVVHVRTYHESLRTVQLRPVYVEKFGIDLRIYESDESRRLPLYGSPEYDEFVEEVKIEPFRRALDELKPLAFLSGRMRWQSECRSDLPFAEQKGDVLVVNPIADVTEEEVEDYFAETGLPRDEHYFDPTKGPDQKSECGLNTTAYKIGDLACQSS